MHDELVSSLYIRDEDLCANAVKTAGKQNIEQENTCEQKDKPEVSCISDLSVLSWFFISVIECIPILNLLFFLTKLKKGNSLHNWALAKILLNLIFLVCYVVTILLIMYS